MPTDRPYFRRRRPSPTVKESELRSDGSFIDFRKIPPPPYNSADPVGETRRRFDDRAAAVVAAAAALRHLDKDGKPKLRSHSHIEWTGEGVFRHPEDGQDFFTSDTVLEFKFYGAGLGAYLMRAKALSVAAYLDFFPDSTWTNLRPWLSSVIMLAEPGFCGTFGATGAAGFWDLMTGNSSEGNYDMNQTALVCLAYNYYLEFAPAARDRLVRRLLGEGMIRRPNRPLGYSSGPVPNDWSRAGYVSPLSNHQDIGETENHILMMLSNRYLTNQLLWQRTHQDHYDNRRNGSKDRPSCFELVLSLLRNILRGDFSEYNAKNYQEETRQALLNLCSFAYDHEVRLAAQMVLDYISARYAVTSNDLRRMVPFRRRNEGSKAAHSHDGFMTVNLVHKDGADPMAPYFAIQAGNIRCSWANIAPGGFTPDYQWGIPGSQHDLVQEVLSTYRLPPSVHDLLVNDAHRRFVNRLHRTKKPGEVGGHRNADNMEINACSPSYLITAGGEAADYAIDPRAYVAGMSVYTPKGQSQQLGVAVTTSFIPTFGFGGSPTLVDNARQVVQLGCFSSCQTFALLFDPSARNYGVAPDFACGHQIRLPAWAAGTPIAPGFKIVDQRWKLADPPTGPGFYLAICEQDGMAVIEALDTWLHPEVSLAQFQASVLSKNGGVKLKSNVKTSWTTWNGNQIEFVIWNDMERQSVMAGAYVLSVKYSGADSNDALGDPGNVTNRFLNGGVLNSSQDALVTISNPSLGTTITLDLRDQLHPRRTDESGWTESAGNKEEVWADFELGPGFSEHGDCCRPYQSVIRATNAVADKGTVKMVPSTSHERLPIGIPGKRFRLVAPIGDVKIGA